MNDLNRKPAHAVPNWQPSARQHRKKKQPAIGESQVEGATRSALHRAAPLWFATFYRAAPRWPAGFPVLVGACQFQFGTAWAGLRLNSFIQLHDGRPIFWCWRTLANSARRGRVCDETHSSIHSLVLHTKPPSRGAEVRRSDRRASFDTRSRCPRLITRGGRPPPRNITHNKGTVRPAGLRFDAGERFEMHGAHGRG